MQDQSNLIHFDDVSKQIHSLCSLIHPLKPEMSAIEDRASVLRKNLPAKASGMIAVIPEVRWGRSMNLLVALNVWGTRSRNWDLHVPQLPMLKGKIPDFEPEKFVLLEETKKAFYELQSLQKSPILLVPVRVERILDVAPKPLQKGEFDIDLASMVWVMGTHHPSFQANRHEIELLCLGERFNQDKVLTVGFKNGQRRVNVRDPDQLTGCLRIVGMTP